MTGPSRWKYSRPINITSSTAATCCSAYGTNRQFGKIRTVMRYLVRARVKPGREAALLSAIENGTLGQGSVAEGEYLRNMKDARICHDETARWVEVCYCPTPLLEEQPYWEQY